MSEAKKVPPLRFKGFDGGWEKKRLEAIVTFSKGKGYSKSDITEEGCPLFLYGRMYTNYQVEVTSVETFCKLRDGSVLSKGGEVVCPASGETAEDIACASAVVEKGIVLGGDLNILTPRKDADIDSVFLALSLTYGTPRNVIKSRAQGKTVVHIHNLDFADIGVFNPPLPEQQKLGEVFRSIDTLIASRETALEKLKAFKKAMLEKMFPRANAKVPEVRFKGFDGEWKKKRLEEMVKKRNESAVSGDLPKLEYEDVVSFEGTLKRSIDQLYAEKRGISFCVGDVLFGKLRPYLGNWFRATFDGVAVGDWWVLKPVGIVSEYLYVLIQSEAFHVAANQSAGSKMPRADWNLVSGALYFVPPTVEEQSRIGAYFRSLDALISARRDEIAKLKDLKKALLDRMFV